MDKNWRENFLYNQRLLAQGQVLFIALIVAFQLHTNIALQTILKQNM